MAAVWRSLKRYQTLLLISGLVFGGGGCASVRAAEADFEPVFIQDCPSCPMLSVIPAQMHQVGSDRGRPEEMPARWHRIDQPFALAVTEATFDQWDACVSDGACKAVENDNNWGRADRPIMRVTLPEVQVYTRWLSEVTGQAYMLPTEAEWEGAARAGTTTRYSWGEGMQPGQAHCRHCEKTDLTNLKDKGLHQTLPVATYAANPYGLYDMVGNVWEWTTTCWARAAKGQATQELTCAQRTVKGSSWYFFGIVGGSPARAAMRADQFSYDVGFRVKRRLTAGEIKSLPARFWQLPSE